MYKIYNIEKMKYGEPFTLCDKHFKNWIDKLPRNILVEKVADKSLEPCNL